MARNQTSRIDMDLVFNADARSAKKEMTQLLSDIQRLSIETQKFSLRGNVKQEVQDASKEVLKFSHILSEAVNVNTGKLDLSKMNKGLKASNTDLKAMARSFSALGSEGVKSFAGIVKQINAAEIPLKKTNAMVDKLWQSLKNTFTWQVSSSALNAFTGAISNAYGYAKNLNKSLNDIRIVTGYSADKMAQFAKEANKAARELSATTQEYTKASLIYYQQGLNESEVAERTKITVQMAKVAGDSASEVSQQLTAVWNNFAKGGQDLTKFADSMTALGAATASSTREISEGLEKFAGVANTVGLSFDYAAAALATITATTRASADTVGTALKTLFARIQDLEMGKTLDDGTTLGKYSQTLKAVGIDIKDANGELKNMDIILSEMGNKWKALAKDEQVALAQGVAGTREYAQLVALMDNWDFMKKNLETSKNAAGTLAEQAKIYEESWKAASDRVKAAAEGLFDDLINDEFFIDLLNGAEKLLDIIKQTVQGLGGVKGLLATISTYVLTIARTQIADELTRLTGPRRKTQVEEAYKTRQEANEELSKVASQRATASAKTTVEVYQGLGRMEGLLATNARELSDEQLRGLNYQIEAYKILGETVIKKSEEIDAAKQVTKEADKALRLAKARKQEELDRLAVEKDAEIARLKNETAEARDTLSKTGPTSAKEKRNALAIRRDNLDTTQELISKGVPLKIFEGESYKTSILVAKIEEALGGTMTDLQKRSLAYTDEKQDTEIIRQEVLDKVLKENKINSILDTYKKHGRISDSEFKTLDTAFRTTQKTLPEGYDSLLAHYDKALTGKAGDGLTTKDRDDVFAIFESALRNKTTLDPALKNKITKSDYTFTDQDIDSIKSAVDLTEEQEYALKNILYEGLRKTIAEWVKSAQEDIKNEEAAMNAEAMGAGKTIRENADKIVKAKEEKEFLKKQKEYISNNQAEKDFKARVTPIQDILSESQILSETDPKALQDKIAEKIKGAGIDDNTKKILLDAITNSEDAVTELSFAVEQLLSKHKDDVLSEAEAMGVDKEALESKLTAMQAEITATSDITAKKKKLAEMEKKLREEYEKTTVQLPTWQNAVVSAAGAVTAFFSSLNALKGMWDSINNPDMSAWEKVTTVFMTLGSVIPGVIMAIKGVTDAKIKDIFVNGVHALSEKADAEAQEKNAKAALFGAKAQEKETSSDKKDIAVNGLHQVSEQGGGSASSKEITGTVLKKAGKTVLKKAGPYMLIAAGIAAAAGIASAASAQFNKYDEAIKKSTEYSKEAAEVYDNASTKYEQLQSGFSQYEDAKFGLSELTKGTEEYEEAIIKANDEALKLIDTYQDLKYTMDSDGLIIIDEESLKAAKEEQLQILKEAQRVKQLMSQNARDAKSEKEQVDFARKRLYSSEDTGLAVKNTAVATGGGLGAGALIGAGIGLLAGPIGALIGAGIGAAIGLIGGTIASSAGASSNEEQEVLDRLAAIYAQSGEEKFTDPDKFKELLTEELKLDDENLIQSLTNNREATLKLARTMAENNKIRDSENANRVKDKYEDKMKSAGLTEELRNTASTLVGGGLDAATEQIYNNKYKDTTFGGLNDATVQKLYAEKMGYTGSKNLGDNMGAYYDSEGNTLKISDEVARKYLAELEALEKMGDGVAEVSKKLKDLSKSSSVADKALLNFLQSEKSFKNMSKTEFEAFIKEISGDDNNASEEEVRKYVNDAFNNGNEITLEIAQSYGAASIQEFYDYFLQSIIHGGYEGERNNALSNYSKYTQDLIQLEIDTKAQNDMSITELSIMGQHVNKALLTFGKEGADFIAGIYDQAKDEAGELAQEMENIDWSTATPTELSEQLKEAGITTTYTTEQLSDLIITMRQATNDGIKDFEKQIKSLSDVFSLTTGSNISEEQFAGLSEGLQSYFTLMADGTRKMTGDALDFYQAVKSERLNLQAASMADKRRVVQRDLDLLELLEQDDILNKTIDRQAAIDKRRYDEYLTEAFAGSNLEYTIINKGSEEYESLNYVYGKDNYSAYRTSEEPDENGKITYNGYDYNNKKYAVDNEEGGISVYATAKSFYEWQNAQNTEKKKGQKVDLDQHGKTIEAQLDILDRTEFASDDKGKTQLYDWKATLEDKSMTEYDLDQIQEAINKYGASAQEDVKNNIKAHREELQMEYQQMFDMLDSAEARKQLFEKEKADEVGKLVTDELQTAYALSSQAAIANEKWTDINVQNVASYAESLQRVADSSELVFDNMSEKAAEEVALYMTKMNKGIETLTNNFLGWYDALAAGEAGMEAYTQALDSTKEALSDTFGVAEEFISEDFIKEHLEEIKGIAEGNVEIIEELRKSLSTEILINISGVDQFEELNSEIQQFHQKLLNEDLTLEVGATLRDEEFVKAANVLLTESKATIEQAQAYFNSLGYEPIFETTKKEVPLQGTQTFTSEVVVDEVEYAGGKFPYIASSVTRTAPFPSGTQKVTVPAISGDGTPQIKELVKTSSSSLSNVGGSVSAPATKIVQRTRKLDVVERYKEITDKINDQTREMDRASKAADRLWGPDRIEKMQDANDALRENIELLKDQQAEASYYLKEDKKYLIDTVYQATGIKVTDNDFSKTGNFTLYDEILGGLYSKLEAAEKLAGTNPTEQQQANIDAIQSRIDAVVSAIHQYDETNTKFKDIEDQIKDSWYQWQDNNLEKINYKLEFEITIADSELELIDYYLEKSKNKFYGEMENYVSKLYEKVGIYGQQSEDGVWDGKVAAFNQNVDELLEARKTGAINTKQFEESLAELQTKTIGEINNLNELKEAFSSVYGDTLNKMGEEVSIFTSKMEGLNQVLDHYSNILDLVGKKDDFDAKGNILRTKAENIRSQLEISKEIYDKNVEDERKYFELMNNAEVGSEEYEYYKAQWQAISDVIKEKQNEILEGTKEWAETIKAEIENEFAKLADIMEDSLTGGLSFDEIETSMERRGNLQEEYLTTTNKIYETTKLMRTAQKAIDESENSVAKKKLNNFVKETQQLQNQGKLSKYELEIQQAKYDLLLAEIALEEAQNAKSVVRLQRDSEGNFGYVYTADQNEIADAQQKLEDANNALYNKGLEGMNDYTQKYYDTLREGQDAIMELTQMWMDGEISSWEEYERRKVELYNYYSEKLQQYSELQSVALSADTEVIQDAWTTTFYNSQVSVEDWKGKVNDYFYQAEDGLNKWKETCAQVLKDSNLEDLEGATGKVADENDRLVKVVMGEDGKSGLIHALQSEIDKIDEIVGKDGAYDEWIKGIDNVISEYEKLFDKINAAKTAAEGLPELPEGWNDGGTYTGGDYSKGYVKYARQGNGSKINVFRDASMSSGYIIDSGGEYLSTDEVKKVNGKLYYGVNVIRKDKGSEGLGYVDEDTYNRLFYGYVDKNQDLKSANDKVEVQSWDSKQNMIGTSSFTLPIKDIDFTSIRWNEYLSIYQAKTKNGKAIAFENNVYQQLLKTLSSFDTGGYTGDWGPEGKLAMLHQKELVLNQQDTSNLLAAVDMLRAILNTIDIHALNSQLGGILTSPSFHHDTNNVLEQNVKIEASFPGIKDRLELEEAFTNLINKASQYANRK